MWDLARMAGHSHHDRAVAALWARLGPDPGKGEVLALGERALDAVWQRTYVTLGEITLVAIVDRVLHTAAKAHPLVGHLKLETSGLRFHELLAAAEHASREDVQRALTCVLVELLTVLGALTGEILTPGMHAALAKLAADGTGEEGGR
jgi:hypothetical protein